MLIITNRVRDVYYYPDQLEDGKWTIFQMTRARHWKKVWEGKRNTTFDTYKECETWMNILAYSHVFGGDRECSTWCGEPERANIVFGLAEGEEPSKCVKWTKKKKSKD